MRTYAQDRFCLSSCCKHPYCHLKCADEEEDLRVSVNVTHDTKCNVIWVDVFGLDEKDNVPLGEGFFTSSNSADSGRYRVGILTVCRVYESTSIWNV